MTAERLYVWVSVGADDRPPGRIEVMICVCGALISVEQAERHSRWHRSLEVPAGEI